MRGLPLPDWIPLSSQAQWPGFLAPISVLPKLSTWSHPRLLPRPPPLPHCSPLSTHPGVWDTHAPPTMCGGLLAPSLHTSPPLSLLHVFPCTRFGRFPLRPWMARVTLCRTQRRSPQFPHKSNYRELQWIQFFWLLCQKAFQMLPYLVCQITLWDKHYLGSFCR